MDLIVGSASGALKGIDLLDNSFQNFNSVTELNPVRSEIMALCWAQSDDETEILCAQADRQLSLFDTVSVTFTALFKLEGGEGKLRGLHTISGNRVVSAAESGIVKLWDMKTAKALQSIDAGVNLHRMRGGPTHGSADSNLLATGGRENCLKLWDLNKPTQPTFVAKNVRPDWLQLRVPIWVTDIRFVPNSQLLFTCTGHHQVRLYDPRSGQRRPVNEVSWFDAPFTSMDVCPDPNFVLAGTTQGDMALFDMRAKGVMDREIVLAKMVKCYKGFAGGIRAVECHPTNNLVATCGIDRFVRVHDIDSKQLLHKIYCKTRLNCLLMKNKLSILDEKAVKEAAKRKAKQDKKRKRKESDSNSSGDDESDSENDEVLWQEMGTVQEGRKNTLRKKRTVSQTKQKRARSPVDRDDEHRKKKKAIDSSKRANNEEINDINDVINGVINEEYGDNGVNEVISGIINDDEKFIKSLKKKARKGLQNAFGSMKNKTESVKRKRRRTKLADDEL